MEKRLKRDREVNGINIVASDVTITRFDSSNHGTFGRLVCDDFMAYTGELPDRSNKSNISRIPTGVYKCVWSYSPRLKTEMYLVEGVSGRSGIRIHSANFMGDSDLGLRKQVNGCIALGEKIGVLEGQKALIMSKPAIRRFEQKMNKKTFTLEIK